MATLLTGSDGESEVEPSGRALRLAAVLYAVQRGPFGERIGDKISRMNDHKGTLEVYWSDVPTFGEMLSVSRAWDEVGLESMTEHWHNGRTLATCDGVQWDVCKATVYDVMAAEVPEDMSINPFRVL